VNKWDFRLRLNKQVSLSYSLKMWRETDNSMQLGRRDWDQYRSIKRKRRDLDSHYDNIKTLICSDKKPTLPTECVAYTRKQSPCFGNLYFTTKWYSNKRFSDEDKMANENSKSFRYHWTNQKNVSTDCDVGGRSTQWDRQASRQEKI